jgi:hypothetical protein
MTTQTKKKKQILNAETITASTGISNEIKIHLNKCPTQAVRSIPLTQWTRELFAISRKQKHTDEEIIGWVKTYAKQGNWTQRQIDYVITENVGPRETRYSDPELEDTSSYHPVELVKAFKKIVVDLSQMQDMDLMDCDYSPDRITENAENNLREWTSRMNEGELRINKKWVKAVSALLKRASELMQQQERVSKLGDMR